MAVSMAVSEAISMAMCVENLNGDYLRLCEFRKYLVEFSEMIQK